ncbi:MAG: DegT/DnrJ/EryC1/StrS family aminotransferase [Ktedonobacterales bacterium]|nr:DegT/DnrJ/EryC1/StrS family aminotransferase [Ktedonobacterales bacterium]
MIPIAHPLLGTEEQEAVMRVLASGQLAHGADVEAFERRFAELSQVREAVAVTSGTAALHLALLVHGVGPGDEVITSPFSFAATGNTILLVGARPVFVDIDPKTYNIDPAAVEAAITPRTKAIMPVHIYGNPADMDQLMALAERHGLTMIEDACQAHLADIRGKTVGSFGTGCFSFYATKNMTTGEGGAVTTNDPEVAERLRMWRSHGQKERYVHSGIGYNYRMMNIQGAIGVVQCEKVERWTEQRIANAAYLTERLREYGQTPTVLPGHRHVYHQYTIQAPKGRDRDTFIQALAERGVGAAVHYPRPIHKQPYYQEHGFDMSLPIAEELARRVISLPVHPALSEADLETVAREVIALCR